MSWSASHPPPQTGGHCINAAQITSLLHAKPRNSSSFHAKKAWVHTRDLMGPASCHPGPRLLPHPLWCPHSYSLPLKPLFNGHVSVKHALAFHWMAQTGHFLYLALHLLFSQSLVIPSMSDLIYLLCLYFIHHFLLLGCKLQGCSDLSLFGSQQLV